MAYPQRIRVTGLPSMWHGWDGWNAVYTKSEQLAGNAPIYLLHGYVLWGLIRIVTIYMMKLNGRWVMGRVGDLEPIFVNRHTLVEAPLGLWSNGDITATVTNADNKQHRERLWYVLVLALAFYYGYT